MAWAGTFISQPSWRRFAGVLCVLMLLVGCRGNDSGRVGPTDPEVTDPEATPTAIATPTTPALDPLALNPDIPREATADLLQESWNAYRQQFIQADGRVIDWEAEGRSTSESQAYAMLRAVLIDDPETFALTLQWGEDNLQRRVIMPSSGGADNSEEGSGIADHLWAWKWGEQALPQASSVDTQLTIRPDQSLTLDSESATPSSETVWDIIDPNFAVDADIDAATALILAARRWNEPAYLDLARVKLQDIWDFSTTTVGDKRYLLPGPKAAFEREDHLILNPSYYAPYAFRLFAQVDPERDWETLADSSYEVLEQVMSLSAVGLPGDWVALERETQTVARLDGTSREVGSENIVSQYAFDAYRVWWRVSLDAVWFDSLAAENFLQQHLGFLSQQWREQQSIPAQMNLAGAPLVDYEATSQYGMLYAAFQQIDPPLAYSIFQQKLFPTYQAGIWDDASAYYSQNLAWLGLFPMSTVPARLLEPS